MAGYRRYKFDNLCFFNVEDRNVLQMNVKEN